MRTALVLLTGLILAAGGTTYYVMQASADPATNFREAAIKRGDLLPTISATGTVEPEEVVDVGSQITGKILSFGIDENDPNKKKTIDFGSIVNKGTELAFIDNAVYKAQRDQADAALLRAKADVKQYEAKYLQAAQEWKRAESLRPKGAISDADYDLATANHEAAKANVAVGKAVVEQSKAALELARTNFDYTIIKSPVKGTVIARRVNIGQTVVSSMSASSMFLIAKDLRRIQVWASVNEADIGRIRIGMPVRFTVDAYPSDVFRGTVSQIRLNATMTQNVVTYTVVVTTDNSDGRLLPYLTANVQFEVDQRSNVLLAPNGALRWKPRSQQIDPEVRESIVAESNANNSGQAEPSSTKPSANAKTTKPDEPNRLWVEFKGFVQPLPVVVGPTDGSMTEVSATGLKEGMKVVVGVDQKASDAEETTNPFAPKLFGRRKAKQ